MADDVIATAIDFSALKTILRTSTEDDVDALIRGLQLSDPKLFNALQLLNQQVGSITEKLQPLIRQSLSLQEKNPSPPLSAINFTAISIGTGVRFDWQETALFPLLYEVREGTIAFLDDLWIKDQTFNTEVPWYDMDTPPAIVRWVTAIIAEDWDAASFRFRTGNLNAIIEPLVEGDHLFLLKEMDSTGSYSDGMLTTRFVVTKIPTTTITKNIIDNNVLLYWEVPSSVFNIFEYRLYKDGVLKATTTATFAAFFELIPGTYTYSIVSVDVAGNLSVPTYISAFVNQPPDFALQDSRISNLSGTKVNTFLTTIGRLLCSWTPETWQHHFQSRSWLAPRSQMDAGYPIYIQPTARTGSYEEVFDYGAVFSNVIVTVTFNINSVIAGSDVTVLVRLATSADNITFSAFSNGATQFFPSFRYLKLRLEFTGADDKALIELYNLTINLNVKREMDGGELYSPSSDVNGTIVYFNKPFKDIESITCTVQSLKEPYMVIYNFVDVPNPTHFFVYVFDTAGNRASKQVEWKARGVV